MIDVRSDTVTRPTPGMLQAMMQARVGDDVYGEDETVEALQTKAAALFGMEAALFCPTGTMSNQIGIKVNTQPGDEVICSRLAHIYSHEGGGIAVHSGASVRLLEGVNGNFTAEQVRANVNRREDPHLPWTRVVAIENTVNLGGGACWDFAEVERIRAVCDQHELALHLDGARLFNALSAQGQTAGQYGRLFTTISICLSKGLGAPAGSLLLGSRTLIAKAKRWRKTMGGGMRQAGYLAAAGLYALDHHVERLRLDHGKARAVAAELQKQPYVAEVLPVQTNIVIFRLAPPANSQTFLRHLESRQIRALGFDERTIRFVFHLDVSDAQLESIVAALRTLH
jgi:threonine aldolase